MIRVKRAYEPPGPGDGRRFLVDRLWPRGVKKEALKIEAWLQGAGPSDQLRRWFAHDPARWTEFRRRYFAELDREPAAWEPLIKAAADGHVTLVYSAHDAQHNNALALKEYLESRLKKRPSHQV